jgi:hypothetical protein
MIRPDSACPCAYCKHFELIECCENLVIVEKGICNKYNIYRELYDELCDEFILMEGVHTKKWYPRKKD